VCVYIISFYNLDSTEDLLKESKIFCLNFEVILKIGEHTCICVESRLENSLWATECNRDFVR
jgi:hypothetical protein